MRTVFKLVALVMALTGFTANAAIDFTPARKIVSCGPNTVYFVYNNDVEPDLIFWDFGDGTSSSEKSPSHFYGNTGVYAVKVVVIKNNVRDSMFKDSFVTINPVPLAQMQIARASDLQAGKYIFTSSSVHNADSFTRQLWIVGTDSVEGDTVMYRFTIAGDYIIKLIVTNNKGCSGESSTTIRIKNDDIEPLGLAEAAIRQANLYPNPAKDAMEIELPLWTANTQVTIIDVAGRRYHPVVERSGGKLVINTSLLSAGAYQLLFTDGAESIAKKFVIMD